MSDHKGINPTKKSLNPSIGRTTIASSQKKTTQKVKNQAQDSSTRKNLLPEFEKIEKQREHQKISSVQNSSISESQMMFSVRENNKHKQYGFQLPQTYILAITGLQEAVKQRDLQIKKLAQQYQSQKTNRSITQKCLSQTMQKNKQSQKKIYELLTQIKIIKQNIIQDRQLLLKSQKTNNELQNTIKLLKQTKQYEQNINQSKIDQLKKYIQQIQYDFNKEKQEKIKISQENLVVIKQNIERKQLEFKNKEKYSLQIQMLREEINIQRNRRIKAQEEINILKTQAQILAQRTVSAERTPLHQIQSNLVRRERQNSAFAQISDRKARMVDKWNQLEKRTEMTHSVSKDINHTRKNTNGTVINRERSTSRMKDRPELVSQYRQLIRQQKQLVGLNYQLQVIQKKMIQNGDKSQYQKQYSKIKRQTQQKQMKIRQLKLFLNDIPK